MSSREPSDRSGQDATAANLQLSQPALIRSDVDTVACTPHSDVPASRRDPRAAHRRLRAGLIAVSDFGVAEHSESVVLGE